MTEEERADLLASEVAIRNALTEFYGHPLAHQTRRVEMAALSIIASLRGAREHEKASVNAAIEACAVMCDEAGTFWLAEKMRGQKT